MGILRTNLINNYQNILLNKRYTVQNIITTFCQVADQLLQQLIINWIQTWQNSYNNTSLKTILYNKFILSTTTSLQTTRLSFSDCKLTFYYLCIELSQNLSLLLSSLLLSFSLKKQTVKMSKYVIIKLSIFIY
jgi:hypothetical protein